MGESSTLRTEERRIDGSEEWEEWVNSIKDYDWMEGVHRLPEVE
jgi:hypothetical protein